MSAALDTGVDVELATRLRLAVGRLNRELRQHAAGGLTPSQLSLLFAVEKAEPVRMGDLAAREGIAPPSVTRIVGALVDLGFVERQSDPGDARSALVRCTDAGHAATRRLREERTAELVQRLNALPAKQRDKLAHAVALLEALVEGESGRR